MSDREMALSPVIVGDEGQVNGVGGIPGASGSRGPGVSKSSPQTRGAVPRAFVVPALLRMVTDTRAPTVTDMSASFPWWSDRARSGA